MHADTYPLCTELPPLEDLDTIGAIDGLKVGAGEGACVGGVDGDDDGGAEGADDGPDEGLAEGDTDGARVDFVGDVEGTFVGLGLGLDVESVHEPHIFGQEKRTG